MFGNAALLVTALVFAGIVGSAIFLVKHLRG